MKIGVDIDDTLGDLHEIVNGMMKETLGVNYCKYDIMHYRLEDALGVGSNEINEILDRYHNTECINIEPLPDAIDVMKQLDKDYEINIITARCFSSFDLTWQWLVMHEIPFNSLVFDHSKWDVCRHMDISIMIEDKGETAIKLAQQGTPCILMDYGWNRAFNHDLIHRVYDWNEIHDKVREILPVKADNIKDE